MTTATTATTTATETWLKTHERLILVTLALLIVLYLGDRFLRYRAATDDKKAQLAAQTLKVQQDKDSQLVAQIAQSQAQYTQLVQQLSAQNAQLAAASQQRTVVLQQQQTKDQTLPLPDVAVRWKTLAGLSDSDITANSQGIDLTDAGARGTINSLEQIPVLQANLKDTRTQLSNTQSELATANNVITDDKNLISNMNTAALDEEQACKTQVTALKAEARKGKIKAFLYGLGAGAGLVLGAAAHIF